MRTTCTFEHEILSIIKNIVLDANNEWIEDNGLVPEAVD
jgi:hypothetical protein